MSRSALLKLNYHEVGIIYLFEGTDMIPDIIIPDIITGIKDTNYYTFFLKENHFFI